MSAENEGSAGEEKIGGSTENKLGAQRRSERSIFSFLSPPSSPSVLLRGDEQSLRGKPSLLPTMVGTCSSSLPMPPATELTDQ
jgi:hypothetical protein